MQINLKILQVIGLILSIVFFSNKGHCQVKGLMHNSSEVFVEEFQEILEKSKLKGSILIYNMGINKLYSNDFEWANKGRLPASTFKIPNSLIALELGVIENDSSVLKWDGEKREMKVWEQDLTLKQAFQLSCVPCYQEVARKIGIERMKQFTSEFQYGNLIINKDNIDKFWLEGESTISQYQQIEFLMAFFEDELPVSKRITNIMKRMMVVDTINGYPLSGKTGWSIRNGNNNGWFVGYLAKPNGNLFFAVNVEPQEEEIVTIEFLTARKQVLYNAIKVLEKNGYSQNFEGNERDIENILENIKTF